MSFLPENTKIPDTSGYFKFQEGDNKFRALGEAVVGTEYWTEEGDKRTPHRVLPGIVVDMSIVAMNQFKKKSISFFIAFPVWNYKSECVQVLVVKQKTVQEPLINLAEDMEWGDPQDYDITVTMKKEGDKPKYSVRPSPKKALSKEIKAAVEANPVNMKSWMAGGDPFTKEENSEKVNPNEIPF